MKKSTEQSLLDSFDGTTPKSTTQGPPKLKNIRGQSNTMRGAKLQHQMSVAAQLGAGNDLLLNSICDWNEYDKSIALNKRMRYPSFLMEDELTPDSWNNIPVPIVKGVQTIMKCLRNLENVVKMINQEQRSRCELIVKKFKVVEKQGHERDDLLKKFSQNLMDRHTEIFERFCLNTNEDIQMLQVSQKKLASDQVEDRLATDERFSNYTKTDDFKQWVQELQEVHHSSLQSQVERNHSEFQYHIRKIMGENLMVPHLVGDGLRYKNLKEFIQGHVKEVDSNFDTLRAAMEQKISEQIKLAKATLNRNIFDAKTNLNHSINGIKNDSTALHEEIDSRLNFFGESNEQKLKELEQANLRLEEKQHDDLEMMETQFMSKQDFKGLMRKLNSLTSTTDKKLEDQTKQLDDFSTEFYDNLERKIEQCERRCKADAQRIVDLATKRQRNQPRGRSNQSQKSGTSQSNANITSQRVLVMSPSINSGVAMGQTPKGINTNIGPRKTMRPSIRYSIKQPIPSQGRQTESEGPKVNKLTPVIIQSPNPTNNRLSVIKDKIQHPSREISEEDHSHRSATADPVSVEDKQGKAEITTVSDIRDVNLGGTKGVKSVEKVERAETKINFDEPPEKQLTLQQKRRSSVQQEAVDELKEINQSPLLSPHQANVPKSNHLNLRQASRRRAFGQDNSTTHVASIKSSVRLETQTQEQTQHNRRSSAHLCETKDFAEQIIQMVQKEVNKKINLEVKVLREEVMALAKVDPEVQKQHRMLAKGLLNIKKAKYGSKDKQASEKTRVTVEERKMQIDSMRHQNMKKFEDSKNFVGSARDISPPQTLSNYSNLGITTKDITQEDIMKALKDLNVGGDTNNSLKAISQNTTLEEYIRLHKSMSEQGRQDEYVNTLHDERPSRISDGSHERKVIELQASKDTNVIQKYLNLVNSSQFSQQYDQPNVNSVEAILSPGQQMSRDLDIASHNLQANARARRNISCNPSQHGTSRIPGRLMSGPKSQQGRRQKLGKSIVATSLKGEKAGGFTTVLENMRGHHESRHANERLRSAYAGAGGPLAMHKIQIKLNQKKDLNSIQVNEKGGLDQPEIVNYEQLSGIGQPKQVLNPNNMKNLNKFGFAQMHPKIQQISSSSKVQHPLGTMSPMGTLGSMGPLTPAVNSPIQQSPLMGQVITQTATGSKEGERESHPIFPFQLKF